MNRFSIEDDEELVKVAVFAKEEGRLSFRDTLSYSSSSSSSSSSDGNSTHQDDNDDDEHGHDGRNSGHLERKRFDIHYNDSPNDTDYDDDDESEMPHPLGFGTTRFGLYTQSSIPKSPRDTALLDDIPLVHFFQWPFVASSSLSSSTYAERAGTLGMKRNGRNVQKSISENPLETKILLQHDQRRRQVGGDWIRRQSGQVGVRQSYISVNQGGQVVGDRRVDTELVSRMNRIAMLVKAASVSTTDDAGTCSVTTKHLSGDVKFQSLLQAARDHRQRDIQVKKEMERYRKELLDKQKKDAEILLSIIHREKAKAEIILYQEQKEEEKIMEEQRRLVEQEREAREQELREQEKRLEQELKEKEMQKELERKEEERRLEQEQIKEAQKMEQEEIEKKKIEYVTKAQDMVEKLSQIRASVEIFETSKDKIISKRRLQMKKIARGKMNTLSHEKDKVEIVTQQVVDALQASVQEDGILKQQMEAGDASVTIEMTRGTRYLMDLIASTVIVRVQAEGFNGTRGDGFPLAHMLAQTSARVEEDFSLLLTAHIYSVCPTAIPTLPFPADGSSEMELMESLGMQKDKNGEYESFDRFLARTEGLISIMGEIVSSAPSDHNLLGGHRGGLVWLERFLDLLPPEQSPLPLLTAPVLVAFLTAAGHMLMNKFPQEFSAMFHRIANDVSKRLDKSTIGQPSATRLNKLLLGGIEYFQNELPHGAIHDFYDSTIKGSSSSSNQFCQPTNQGSVPPFGTFNGENSQEVRGNTVFGVSAPPPFGSKSLGSSDTSQPYGTMNQSQQPFINKGLATTAPSSSSAFPQVSAPTSFGAMSSLPMFGSGQVSNTTPSPFATNVPATTTSTFGTSVNQFAAINPSAPSPSPFGTSNTPAPSVFGSAPSSFGKNNNTGSPFENSSISPTPFGFNNATSASSPFGPATSTSNPFGQTAFSNPSTSFGGGKSNISNLPPLAPVQNTFGNPSPLGGGLNTLSSPSPFGGGQNTFGNPSPFGAGANTFGSPSPFGGGQNTLNNPSPFGSGQNTFSSSTPFGGAQNTLSKSSPFGGAQNAFGNPSPFGTSSNTTPFGASNSNAFSGNKKEPCKYFSQGKCKYGSNCKYSHDVPTTQQGANSGTIFGQASRTGISPFGNVGGNNIDTANKNQPCKYFAQGTCKFGANCKYSHATQGFGGFNNSARRW